MSSNSLKDTQLFFKSILKSRIKNPSKYKEYSNKFSLNFLNYDLYDEDINKITQLIVDTEKMTSLSIRLSDTLQDKNILNKLLRKISLKKQDLSPAFLCSITPHFGKIQFGDMFDQVHIVSHLVEGAQAVDVFLAQIPFDGVVEIAVQLVIGEGLLI